ncbi:MAG: ral secretion pathway protein GspH [Gemmatimonadetes bacterium]|jgi:prepilin-type N-terminal cleavage/methylation domain-containing protein|nr:ral secretion pathway protein GspH [Gemmatimonadota bacterium]
MRNVRTGGAVAAAMDAWRTAGFTLVELLTVLVLMVLLCALAAPSSTAMLARYRTRGALNLLTGDLYYARMLAVKGGTSVSLRVLRDPACPVPAGAAAAGRGYVIVARGDPGRPVKAERVGADGAKVCLASNRSDSIVFDSRGLLSPPGNRTFWAGAGGLRDSVQVSVVGRVARRF